MARLLGRLGGWCARHGRVVLAAWIILAAALTAGTLVFGRPVSNNVSIPGSDAQQHQNASTDLANGFAVYCYLGRRNTLDDGSHYAAGSSI